MFVYTNVSQVGPGQKYRSVKPNEMVTKTLELLMELTTLFWVRFRILESIFTCFFGWNGRMDTDFDNRIGSLKRNKTFQTTGRRYPKVPL